MIPKESVPASRKLGADDARALANGAVTVMVAKGKKVETFKPAGKASAEMIQAMLGPTGNLRAPTVVCGKTVLVGFNEECYVAQLG